MQINVRYVSMFNNNIDLKQLINYRNSNNNNDMPECMFDTENLYEDLVKTRIKIHQLNRALHRGLETFVEFRELFIKIENCNDINLIKTLRAEFRATHAAPQFYIWMLL